MPALDRSRFDCRYLSVVLTISICMLGDVAAKFVWRNYRELFRHPVDANALKVRLQREYMGVKKDKRARSPSQAWAHHLASMDGDRAKRAQQRRLADSIPQQKVMINGKEVLLPVGSYTAAYVNEKVAGDKDLLTPQTDEDRCENYEFCIKNEKFCIKKNTKTRNSVFKMMNSADRTALIRWMCRRRIVLGLVSEIDPIQSTIDQR